MKNIVNHLLAFSLKMIVSHIFEVHKLKKTPQFYPWAKSAEMPCSDSLSSRYELFHPENKCLCLLNLTRNFRRQQTSSVREHLIRGFSQADELLCSITVAKGTRSRILYSLDSFLPNHLALTHLLLLRCLQCMPHCGSGYQKMPGQKKNWKRDFRCFWFLKHMTY